MITQLTTAQERFVQAKLETGQYQNTEEILEAAFQLLEERDLSLNSPELDQATRQEDQQRLDKYRQTKQGVPHDQVAAWLDSIGTDHEKPCPTS
jgi:Arc/MetJ-type ribon-helix-helix transcriptional regulator